MPQFYYIVSRGAWDLYELLRQDFIDEPGMQVVLDRRRGERRHSEVGHAVERRRRDRRRRDHDIAEQLQQRGCAVVPRPAD